MTLTLLDYNNTFTIPNNSTATLDIQPGAGEVWCISLWAKIVVNGDTADDLYLYLRSDTGLNETASSMLNNVNAAVQSSSIVISNDNYLRLYGVAATVGSGDRTVVYRYQGWKIE